MKKTIHALYFSPTDGTKKIVHQLGQALDQALEDYQLKLLDITPLNNRQSYPKIQDQDILILGFPTYAGRLPSLLLPYLKDFPKTKAYTIPLVTFGNRDFDDALMELGLVLKDKGARILAGGTFVGQHSFSKTLAQGRPNQADLQVGEDLAQAFVDKLRKKDFSKACLPGQNPIRPYYTPRDHLGKSIDFVKIKVKTDLDKCINCKLCARLCPLGSIDFDQVDQVPGKCMKCNACVKHCPTEAKYFDDENYHYHRRELEAMYGDKVWVSQYYL